jgi:hypothetical protein
LAGKRFVATACALVGMGTAACGGDSEKDSGSEGEFAAQADQICIDGQREIVGIAQDLGPITSDDDVIPRIEKFIPVRDQTRSELAALDAPAEAQPGFDEMLEVRGQIQELAQEELKLRKAGDLDKAARVAAKSKQLQEQGDAAAEEAGLIACARILPDEDAEQAKAAITELETSDDPALCAETMTDLGVESLFGGLKKCEATQRGLKPSDLAESVTFEKVSGVEGVTASILGTVNGGSLDGDHAQYELVYEDGAYKVNSVFAAP